MARNELASAVPPVLVVDGIRPDNVLSALLAMKHSPGLATLIENACHEREAECGNGGENLEGNCHLPNTAQLSQNGTVLQPAIETVEINCDPPAARLLNRIAEKAGEVRFNLPVTEEILRDERSGQGDCQCGCLLLHLVHLLSFCSELLYSVVKERKTARFGAVF